MLPHLEQDSTSGIFQDKDKAIALEVGSARKGHDVSLGRQAAALHAKTNLLLLLKSKELVPGDTQSLSGVTIEKYWMKGGKIFALAKLELQNIPKNLNVRGSSPSNASEDTQKDTAKPQGGAEK